MMRSYSFLSFGFACLATALLVIGILAMPTQGVWANDPTGGGSPAAFACASSCYCDNVPTCKDTCEYPFGSPDGPNWCNDSCNCLVQAGGGGCTCSEIIISP